MSDVMSQEEIDQMINGQIPAAPAANPSVGLTADEMDTLGEIGNICMGTGATALHSILGRKVSITTPHVQIVTPDTLTDDHEVPFVVVSVEYTQGLTGTNLLILQVDDVKLITDIMLGGDGSSTIGDLSELHLSAISEAMNQMMGGMATAMADMLDYPVNISPPQTLVVSLSSQEIVSLIKSPLDELVRISFKMQIEGIIDSGIMQLMPLPFAKKLVDNLLHKGQTPAPQPVPDQARSAGAGRPVPPAAKPAAAPANSASWPVPAKEPQSAPHVEVRPIQLTSFDAMESSEAANRESSLNIIMDVPLQISVELGQCKKTIKEILELSNGSVVALDKVAGEPVDIVVNGKMIAKGEVIVIDDNYGVRITEIVMPSNRIRHLR
ncbi:MAG: flagellar motor switch phosphatase FliY [Clostridiaceae bacterium]|nr:flagellar motor switch phosphatase FliY [Clostridiaceae bacterium]